MVGCGEENEAEKHSPFMEVLLPDLVVASRSPYFQGALESMTAYHHP